MKNKTFKVNGHTVGIYDPDNKVFTKQVQDSKHRMRILDAWGIDVTVINDLPDEAIIKIRETETGDKYTCLASDYKTKGQYYHFKQFNKDHNTQLFLPLKEFTKTELTEDEKERNAYLRTQGIKV